jgi:hypothetical protein
VLPWKGLLDPLDADLRAPVMAYMAESSHRPPTTYGFNSDDESSLDASSCSSIPPGVSHPEHYTVIQFLYATLRPSTSMAVARVV